MMLNFYSILDTAILFNIFICYLRKNLSFKRFVYLYFINKNKSLLNNEYWIMRWAVDNRIFVSTWQLCFYCKQAAARELRETCFCFGFNFQVDSWKSYLLCSRRIWIFIIKYNHFDVLLFVLNNIISWPV